MPNSLPIAIALLAVRKMRKAMLFVFYRSTSFHMYTHTAHSRTHRMTIYLYIDIEIPSWLGIQQKPNRSSTIIKCLIIIHYVWLGCVAHRNYRKIHGFTELVRVRARSHAPLLIEIAK